MRSTALLFVMALCFAVTANAQVYIQEFSSDPFGDPAMTGTNTSFDANLDGSGDSSEDEFVEIVNDSGMTVDMTGWELHDRVGLRHKFAATDRMLPDGCAFVIFGGGDLTNWNSGGRPLGVTASVGFLGLNNGGDDIIIYDGDPTMGASVVTMYTYTGSPSPDNGDGTSVTRDPEGAAGAFTSQFGLNGLRGTPGFMNDGTTVYCGVSLPGPAYPGSGGDCTQQVSVNGVLQTELSKIHTATANDLLGISVLSPGGTLDGNPFSTILSTFPTGMPPAPLNIGAPGADVYLGSGGAILLVDGLAGGAFNAVLVPGGYVIGTIVPVGLGGTSALLQSFAFDPSGPFQFCFSDANEIQL